MLVASQKLPAEAWKDISALPHPMGLTLDEAKEVARLWEKQVVRNIGRAG